MAAGNDSKWTLLEMPDAEANSFRGFLEKHLPEAGPILGNVIATHCEQARTRYQRFIDDDINIGLSFCLPVKKNASTSPREYRYSLIPYDNSPLAALREAENALYYATRLLATSCQSHIKGQMELLKKRYGLDEFIIPELRDRHVPDEVIDRFKTVMQSHSFMYNGHRAHYVVLGNFDYDDPADKLAQNIVERSGISGQYWKIIQSVYEAQEKRLVALEDGAVERLFSENGTVVSMLSASDLPDLINALGPADSSKPISSSLHDRLTLPVYMMSQGFEEKTKAAYTPSDHFVRAIKGRQIRHPVTQGIISDEIGRIAGVIKQTADTLSPEKEDLQILCRIQAEACQAIKEAAAQYKMSLGPASGLRTIPTEISRS